MCKRAIVSDSTVMVKVALFWLLSILLRLIENTMQSKLQEKCLSETHVHYNENHVGVSNGGSGQDFTQLV